jgi:hypothetical protein
LGTSEISKEEAQVSARAKEHWHELTTRELNAAKRLGWSAQSWDEGTAPSCGRDGWGSLTAEEQGAAVDLGYDRRSWQQDFVETPGSPVFGFELSLETLPLKDLRMKCIEECVDDAAFTRALNSSQQSVELCRLLRRHRTSKLNENAIERQLDSEPMGNDRTLSRLWLASAVALEHQVEGQVSTVSLGKLQQAISRVKAGQVMLEK